MSNNTVPVNVHDTVQTVYPDARNKNAFYVDELELRNFKDLAEWYVEKEIIPQEQFENLCSMFDSPDKESQYLAAQIIKIKQEEIAK